MLKDNRLTFNNAYKQAVAEELAAKCSIECNASSSRGGGGTASTKQVNSVNRVGRKTMPTKVQFLVVLLSTTKVLLPLWWKSP